MKLLYTYLIFFTFLSTFAQSEIISNTQEKIPLKAERFIGIDTYGDLYYLKNRTLFKQTKTETFQFKDFQLGTVGSVDLLNPLKITVFFPNYQTAVILDNKLNEINRIPFAMEPPFLNIKNATTANDNRLWTFNEDNQQLELYNYREKTNQQLSRPLSENYFTHKSNFNFCYLLTNKNLRLFNIYGSLLSSISAEGIQKMSLSNDKLVVSRNDSLVLLSENLTKKESIKMPDLPVKDLYLSDEFLYIYDGEMIHKLKLTKTQN